MGRRFAARQARPVYLWGGGKFRFFRSASRRWRGIQGVAGTPPASPLLNDRRHGGVSNLPRGDVIFRGLLHPSLSLCRGVRFSAVSGDINAASVRPFADYSDGSKRAAKVSPRLWGLLLCVQPCWRSRPASLACSVPGMTIRCSSRRARSRRSLSLSPFL